ncbi:MAG: DUF4178 domain-containing protein [Thermodesulfobacteriota bacterium]
MDRKFQCPSCGAGQTVTNPGVLMKVCDFCRTAMYWDKDSALRAGEKSLDLPPSSRFKVGATGKINKKPFMVLGRLAYSHEQGTWSEWFIEMEDGSIQWLAEDEGELFLEQPVEIKARIPAFEDLTPGMKVDLDDKVGTIEELGKATCLGGEGQIPFLAEIGEEYPYADGSGTDGGFSFGLEYDTDGGNPTVFIGKAFSVAKSEAAAAGFGPDARAAEAIRCPSCGKPYEGPRLATTEMIVCPSCNAALSLDKAQAAVIGKVEGKKPAFAFEVGTTLTFDKVSYEVMGRLHYVEKDGAIEYPSNEYILYHPEKGYLWLSEDKGHFCLSNVVHDRYLLPRTQAPRRTVTLGRDEFLFYESGALELRWVDGALPWTATVGEQTQYVHAIKPPEFVDREKTGQEVELFRGRYVDRAEMLSAVPKGTRLPEPRGIYPCQPYVPPQWCQGAWKFGTAFLIVNALLLLYSFQADKGTRLYSDQVTYEQYSKEYLSKPFLVPSDTSVLRLKGSAGLSNSWLALDFALVDPQDKVINEFGDGASYYHGRDSEGNWTEGSRTFKKYFRVDKAGEYRLLVHGQGGSAVGGPAGKESVSLLLEGNATVSWYFFVPLVLSAIVGVWEFAFRWVFESRRWAPVYQDDD